MTMFRVLLVIFFKIFPLMTNGKREPVTIQTLTALVLLFQITVGNLLGLYRKWSGENNGWVVLERWKPEH